MVPLVERDRAKVVEYLAKELLIINLCCQALRLL